MILECPSNIFYNPRTPLRGLDLGSPSQTPTKGSRPQRKLSEEVAEPEASPEPWDEPWDDALAARPSPSPSPSPPPGASSTSKWIWPSKFWEPWPQQKF